MTTVRIANTFITGFTKFSADESSDYPFLNACNVLRSPLTQARLEAAGAAALEATIKMPTGVSLARDEPVHFFFDWCNFRRVGISIRGSGGGGTPLAPTWAVSRDADPAVDPNIHYDPIQKVYRGLVSVDRVEQEYFQVGMNTSSHLSYPQSAVDNASWFRVGTMAVIRDNDLKILEADVTLPLAYQRPKTNVREARSGLGAVIDRRRFGHIDPLTFSLNFEALVEQNMAGTQTDQLWELLGDYDKILFVDLGMEKHQKYLVRRISDISGTVKSGTSGVATFQNVSFAVVI